MTGADFPFYQEMIYLLKYGSVEELSFYFFGHRSVLLQSGTALLSPHLWCFLLGLCLPGLCAGLCAAQDLHGLHAGALDRHLSVHPLHSQVENC